MEKIAVYILAVLLLGFSFTSCAQEEEDKEPSDAEAEVLEGIFGTVFQAMSEEPEPGITVTPDPPAPADMVGHTYTVTASAFSPQPGATVSGSIALAALSYSGGILRFSMAGSLSGGPFEGVMYEISCDGAVISVDAMTGAATGGSGDITVNGTTYDLGAAIAKIESLAE